MYQLLEKTGKVYLEARNLAFIVSREIGGWAESEGRVLNSAKLPLVWGAPAKADKEGAMKLAYLMEERKDGKPPIAPLPGERELGRRKLLFNYRREVRDRTRRINRLHALFARQGHTTVVKKQLARGSGGVEGSRC
ncbi:MAG: hypothetical protein LBL45_13080 [Treponema sp.]|nr:hypothetical protein [Treponema sp.]